MTTFNPTMKMFVALSIFAAFPAWAAGGIRPSELQDRIGKEVKVESINAHDTRTREVVATRLGKFTKGGTTSAIAAGLDKKVIAIVDGSETQIDLWSVADSIGKSADLLSDSSRIGTDLSKEAADLKAKLESSVETYADSLALVSGHIFKVDSKEGKAIGKILLMGSEIAKGKLSAEETDSYTELVRSISDMIRTGKAQTSEQGLAMALDQLQPGKRDQKIEELNSCKI